MTRIWQELTKITKIFSLFLSGTLEKFTLNPSSTVNTHCPLIVLSYNYLLAFRCIIQPDKKQLNVKASCLISIVMGFLAIGMSIPLFLGTQLKDYVSFGAHTELNDILLCSDIRSGDMRYVY